MAKSLQSNPGIADKSIKNSPESKRVQIYTDGSCDYRNRVGGWACIVTEVDDLGHVCCLDEFGGKEVDTTNNRQELSGVLNALRYLHKHELVEAIIYTDSNYVVTGYNNYMHNWVCNNWMASHKNVPIKNPDLWKAIYDLYDPNYEVIWIPGHSDIDGNEMADKLSNKYRKS